MRLRLDKFLCDMGFGTRSEVKKLIAGGVADVNGSPEQDAGRKIDTETDRISFCGKEIHYRRFSYYMLNKPAGVISASRADLRNKEERCVVDLITEGMQRGLFPVGRLDKDTEGLLLITNDGALAHALLSPKKHVWKTYYARLRKPLSERAAALLEAGVDIGDETPTLPCRVEAGKQVVKGCSEEEKKAEEIETEEAEAKIETDEKDGFREILITIREGRYHQIKRMAAVVGNEVIYLKRLSMGSLKLDENLKPGMFRELTEEELAMLPCSVVE